MQSLWSRLQGWLWSWIHPPPPVQCAESQPIDPKIIELLQNFVDHCKYRDIQVKPSTRTTLIYIINWILTEEEVRPGFSYLRDGVFAALADVAHNLTSDPDWLTAYFYIALHVSERPILYCLQRNAFPLPAKEVHQQLIEKIERYSWPERAQMKTCVLSGNSLYIADDIRIWNQEQNRHIHLAINVRKDDGWFTELEYQHEFNAVGVQLRDPL